MDYPEITKEITALRIPPHLDDWAGQRRSWSWDRVRAELDLPSGMVNLAHEAIERFEGFVQGGVIVPLVCLEEIDPLRAESPEAPFDRFQHALAAQLAGYLGGQDKLIADRAPAEPLADDLLRGPLPVHGGRIQQVDAAVDGVVEDIERRGRVDLTSEGDAAQADRADAEVGVAELSVFHGHGSLGFTRPVALPPKRR